MCPPQVQASELFKCPTFRWSRDRRPFASRRPPGVSTDAFACCRRGCKRTGGAPNRHRFDADDGIRHLVGALRKRLSSGHVVREPSSVPSGTGFVGNGRAKFFPARISHVSGRRSLAEKGSELDSANL
jgi:hypothetical protein